MNAAGQYACSEFPPGLATFSQIVDAQPVDVRELFHYALAMLLVEDSKATIVERRTIDGREWLRLVTTGNELFSVVKPDVDDDVLARLRGMAREALEDESGE